MIRSTRLRRVFYVGTSVATFYTKPKVSESQKMNRHMRQRARGLRRQRGHDVKYKCRA